MVRVTAFPPPSHSPSLESSVNGNEIRGNELVTFVRVKERTNNSNVSNADQPVNGDPPLSSVTIEVNTPEIEERSRKTKVTNRDVTWLIFSIIVQIVGIGLDVHTVNRYITNEKYMYLAWTGVFIFLSNAVRTFFSFQITNIKKQQKDQGAQGNERRTSPNWTNCATQWVSYVFLCLFQLVPLIHDFDSLRSAIKSQRYQRHGRIELQRHFYMQMVEAAPNIALLKMFECFLETVPRQLLQVTILLGNSPVDTIDLVTCLLSLMSMGWSVANYHRTIKRLQSNTNNMDIRGAIVDFIWHSFVIVSRIVCICVVSTICLESTGVACILHWAAMTIWLAKDPHGLHEFSEDSEGTPFLRLIKCKDIGRKLLASSLGIIYLFTYVNPGKRSTNFRHVIYYVLYFVENIIAIYLSISYSGDNLKSQWHYGWLTVFCALASSVAMTFTIIDYVPVNGEITIVTPTQPTGSDQRELDTVDGPISADM